jgi:hypothetical protein
MPVFAAEVQIDDFVVCRQRDTVECADRRLRPRFEPAWERMPRASHRVLQGAMDRALQDGLRGTLVEQFSPHGLRAGFVTTAYRNGVPKNSWVIPGIGANHDAELRSTGQAQSGESGWQVGTLGRLPPSTTHVWAKEKIADRPSHPIGQPSLRQVIWPIVEHVAPLA